MTDPVTSTYAYRMETPVSRPPERVISLVPGITESLFDLNLGNRLIAITDACIYPPEGVAQLPRIGPPDRPQIHRITELRPGLVIADSNLNRPEDLAALKAAGVKIWVTAPQSMADGFNLLWNLMHTFDETSMVPRIRLVEQTMDWIWRMSEIKLEQNPCRVFVPISLTPLQTIRAGSYTEDVLRICGAVSLLAGSDEPLTWEEVEAAQPDMILLPVGASPLKTDDVEKFMHIDVPAVRYNQVIPVDGSLLFWVGTRMAHALNFLPALLCP
jgi:ABC-type Fe3+-hydroxamate transport system substrate-binding protein